ncbi:hypothetical protein BG015_000299 [Linnemannia schmuckeri]|uniref:HCP-like protein n=1 Tax=Linnemannia schmuckeri TaxID=64567 RepID=A0A9P5V769_9FUNG|nr:hypothetical protein BG015_000299 [Linnemannia schmuckeri]
MTIQETHPNVQAVRRVYENGHSSNASITTAETIYLVCHPDPSSEKDILLWDDILAAFKGDVVHVRSGAVVLPFLKGPDFKNLEPLRIAAVPGATLDVVVIGQLSGAKELSLESLQNALPDTQEESNNTIVRRNPVGGLVEEAIQNYTHIDNPATSPPCRGPQAILEDKAFGNDSAAQEPTKVSNSDSHLRAPQELSPAPTATDFEKTMMKTRFGDKEAQNAVGESYHKGRGIQQDYQAAMDWYLKAAEQGNTAAQSNIGYMYETDLGVTKDYSQAMEWYQKAADQGNVVAQHNIGFLYEYGNGVEKDKVKAMKWYKKAAEGGEADAKKALVRLEQLGHDIQVKVKRRGLLKKLFK